MLWRRLGHLTYVATWTNCLIYLARTMFLRVKKEGGGGGGGGGGVTDH